MDVYSRMIAAQKRQNIKRRRYYESDSSDCDAESIEDNHCDSKNEKRDLPKKQMTITMTMMLTMMMMIKAKLKRN